MNKNNSIGATYPSHMAAEATIKEPSNPVFDLKKLLKDRPQEHSDWPMVCQPANCGGNANFGLVTVASGDNRLRPQPDHGVNTP